MKVKFEPIYKTEIYLTPDEASRIINNYGDFKDPHEKLDCVILSEDGDYCVHHVDCHYGGLSDGVVDSFNPRKIKVAKSQKKVLAGFRKKYGIVAEPDFLCVHVWDE